MWSSDTLIRLVEVGFVLVVAMLLLVPTLYAFNWLFRHLVRIANPGQLACHYGSPQAVSACPRGRAMAAVCQLCYADKQFASYYELIDASHLPMHVLLSWVRTIAEHLDGDASPLMSVDTWHRYATRQRWYQAATWHPYHIDWYAPELAVLWGCVHLWLRRYGTRPPSRQLLQHIATKACPKGYLRPYFDYFAQQPDKCEDDAVQVSINIGQLVWNNNGTINQHTTTMTEDQRNHPLPPLVQGDFVNNGQFAYENTGTMNFNAQAAPASARPGQPTNEQVARAIMAVSGEGGPLRSQKHYVGVISVLMWLGWPQKFAPCCTRINQLPCHEQFAVACSESGLWRTTAMGFARVTYDKWETYTPREGEEEAAFRECKAVADAFCTELLRMERPM